MSKSLNWNIQTNLKSYLDEQPNGGTGENCLTSFRLRGTANPLWYDRPCDEIDTTGELGHSFMCECKVEEHEKQSEPLTSQIGMNFSNLLGSLFIWKSKNCQRISRETS